jgi:Uma2 family endonuclease
MRAVIADMPKHWLAERKNSKAAQWDEVWEGVLHMPPMPNGMHQDFALDLASFLKWEWAKPRGGLVRQEVNLTTPEDEEHWTLNFRIPDLVLVSKERLGIDRNEYLCGAPLVVVEVKSPKDETYEKFPFYAKLGVPEVWVFDRDTRVPELYALAAGPAYQPIQADPQGWLVSPAAGVAFRHAGGAKVAARVGGGPATELPDG